MGKHICRGVLAVLLLIVAGCATAPPKPVTIRHQIESIQQAAPADVHKTVEKDVDGGSAEALAELLKSKKILSDEEAARFVKAHGAKAAGKKAVAGTAEEIAGLVALLKEKKVISADEAHAFLKQNNIRVEGPTIVPSVPDKGDNEKQVAVITKNVTEEVNKTIQEQVKSRVQEEVAREIGKSDRGRIEQIAASVREEVMKGLPEQLRGPSVVAVPAAQEKSDKEQVEKITAAVAGEVKKDLQDQIRIQVREEVPREMKKIETASAELEWVKRIRFGGDIRLRYQNDRFDRNNADLVKPDSPTQLMNTKIDQNRFRYRVRVGVAVVVNDRMEAVIRLGTGNDSNPISTNSTMGDYMNRDTVYFDLAYLKWQPWKFLTVYGGRMPNPWYSSDLVWSNSLNFEGIALNINKSITETLSPFLTVGAFPLQQNDFSQEGKWLFGGQLGLAMKRPKGISAKIGTAYYNFKNITGVANDPLNPGLTDWTAPLYQQKGNTLFDIGTGGVIKTALASEFKLLNITGNLDIGFWDPVHIVFLGDYVRNLGYDRFDVAKRTGNANPEEQTDGYQIGMSVGYPTIQAFGQWKVYIYYKYLEADAVVDAFTDSDFHLGGTNAKGWIFGVDFGLSKNFWMAAKWLTANEIIGPQLAIDVLQVDLNAKF